MRLVSAILATAIFNVAAASPLNPRQGVCTLPQWGQPCDYGRSDPCCASGGNNLNVCFPHVPSKADLAWGYWGYVACGFPGSCMVDEDTGIGYCQPFAGA